MKTLTDAQIRALKERCEKHNDIWWRDRNGQAYRLAGVRLDYASAESQAKSAPTQPVALLANGRILALRHSGEDFPFTDVDLSQFVTLKPWDGAPTPAEVDNLTLLQDAARNGLAVNFMTGDVQLPPGTNPDSSAAR